VSTPLATTSFGKGEVIVKLPTLKHHFLLISTFLCAVSVDAAESGPESKYYKIVDVPIPAGIELEVGGLAFNNNGQLGVSTRRGEVWVLDKPLSDNPGYQRFAHGLHEPLGLAFKDNAFYAAQRSELTRLQDQNNDGVADLYQTIQSWPLSGNYHEYSFGPVFQDNGDMLVPLNVAWIGGGASLAKWRGWLVNVSTDGKLQPFAAGLRSPSSLVVSQEGDIFYSENQGDWVGSGRITHLERGDFAGHPAGLKWSQEEGSPLSLKVEDIPTDAQLSLYERAKQIPALKAPAVWLPHATLGISTSDMVFDYSGGQFGPFENQMFVGDQGHSKIVRVALEKVNGVFQGAAFGFVDGFSSGVLRMAWAPDNSMMVGMTNRGWKSLGPEPFGLQRLVWTGKTPFEMKTIKARDNGFLIEFTQVVDPKTATDPAAYKISTFTYRYSRKYGSPVEDLKRAKITDIRLSDDKKSATLTVAGMRLGFVHEIDASGVTSGTGQPLLHTAGYYTLNEVPGGKLISEAYEGGDAGDAAVASGKRVNTLPETWSGKSDITVKLGVRHGMLFDTDTITVDAGDRVALEFDNTDDMLHNVVIVQGGDAVETVARQAIELGMEGMSRQFVPKSDLVIAHTGLVQPGSSETIYFIAPKQPGEYTFVCTFPGHAGTMRGKFIVR
jgi:azurin/glucose/arabinose dehydrogenase